MFFLSVIGGGLIGLLLVTSVSIPNTVVTLFGYQQLPILGETSTLTIAIVGGCAMALGMVYQFITIKTT